MARKDFYEDLLGQKFGRLKVQARVKDEKKPLYLWQCLCDCGTTKMVPTGKLKAGRTNSCGCLRREVAATRFASHLQSRTRFYKIWKGMESRCRVLGNYMTKNYGDRGIKVCERWHDFAFFQADMKASYDAHVVKFGEQDTTIEREDNDKGYEPDNVRWATRAEQTRNQRTNKFITYEGQTYTIAEWARRLRMEVNTLARRLKSGWSIEKAFTYPVHHEKGLRLKNRRLCSHRK